MSEQLSFAITSPPAPPEPQGDEITAESIEERFERFHRRQPEVYATLVRLARRRTRAGWKRLSIKMLFEVTRWEMEITTGAAEDFKLNNDYTALYARLIMAQEPDLAGIFATRERRSLEKR